MPKVLRIINRFNIGGPTYNAAYLTKYLPSEYETLLIGGDKEESEDSSQHILDELGINPIIIPEMRRAIRFGNDYAAYKKIKQIIEEFKPDIVHTHASKAGTLGRMAAFACNVPAVVHTFHGHVFHSYFSKAKTTIFKRIEKKLALKSSAIVAISAIQKEELGTVHKIAPLDKIEVIPLGFDLERFQNNLEEKRAEFRKEYQIKDDEIAIGIIGRLVPIKNHQLFLNALRYVLDHTDKKVRAFIIGDGESRNDIINLAKDLNIPFSRSNVKFEISPLTLTSWIKNIDIVNAGMDIIALSSLNEGTPVSLIEAQAANNPVVSTNVGGIENVVLQNKTGLLSDVEDLETYSANLLELVENDSKREAMSKEGWKHVKDQYSYKRLVSDVDKLYKDLLK
jgi:glycosyltransferase involved in cell wall biosynthesis|tara:strand:- start:197 stop:1381 length:1185 start_codon:yes stop_codon:yes gene_type:complete